MFSTLEGRLLQPWRAYPQKEKRVISEISLQFLKIQSAFFLTEGAFYFSQKNTEEQISQRCTETLSQPISQNLTANRSLPPAPLRMERGVITEIPLRVLCMFSSPSPIISRPIGVTSHTTPLSIRRGAGGEASVGCKVLWYRLTLCLCEALCILSICVLCEKKYVILYLSLCHSVLQKSPVSLPHSVILSSKKHLSHFVIMSFCLQKSICLSPSLCHSVFKKTSASLCHYVILSSKKHLSLSVTMLFCLQKKHLSLSQSLCYSVWKRPSWGRKRGQLLLLLLRFFLSYINIS